MTDEWSEAASKRTGVVSPTFTRLQDGRVLVVGGLRKIGLTSSEIYDPMSDTWSVTESMSQPTRRSRWSVVLNDGRVLVGGGGSLGQLSTNTFGSGGGRSVEVYDPETGIWSAAGSTNKVRFWGKALLLQDGRVLTVGGIDENGTDLRSAEIYDPSTDTWTLTTEVSQGR